MTTIIDYGAGNIKSVEKALIFLGEEVKLSSDSKDIINSDRVILPGVGSFGSAMESLKASGTIPAIKEVIEKGIPFIGICLGYQMLFDGSEEDGGVPGLSILPGDVKKFPKSNEYTVPQIGWNSLKILKSNALYEDIKPEPFVYFVHSYYVKSKDESIVATKTDYILEYDSSCEKDSLFGCQFHPEKSSLVGLNIMRNFLSCTRKE